MIRLLTTAVLLISCAFAQSTPDNATRKLQKRLESLIRGHHGRVALYVENLKTGQKITINSDVEVPTASVIKLAIFNEAFSQIKSGKLSLAEKIEIKKDDQVEGSGQLQHFDTPLTISLRDAVSLMMIESDNTATNLLIDRIGRESVNRWLADHDFRHTYLYKKVYRKPEGDVPSDQPKFGLGKTTAAEMAGVMKAIYRCEINDPQLCELMLSLMKKQSYRNMIPHYLEMNVDVSEQPSQIASKLGQLDASRSEVGIVYTKEAPILISAFTFENRDTRWTYENEAELLIARIAQIIVESWSGARSAGKHVVK